MKVVSHYLPSASSKAQSSTSSSVSESESVKLCSESLQSKDSTLTSHNAPECFLLVLAIITAKGGLRDAIYGTKGTVQTCIHI
jgi:hypothetical protein